MTSRTVSIRQFSPNEHLLVADIAQVGLGKLISW